MSRNNICDVPWHAMSSQVKSERKRHNMKICHQNSIKMFTSVPKTMQCNTTTYPHRTTTNAAAGHIMHSFCLIWGHSTCPPSAYLFAHWSLDSDSNGKLKRKLTHRFVPIINLPGCCLCLPVTMLLYQTKLDVHKRYSRYVTTLGRKGIAAGGQTKHLYASFHTHGCKWGFVLESFVDGFRFSFHLDLRCGEWFSHVILTIASSFSILHLTFIAASLTLSMIMWKVFGVPFGFKVYCF